MVSFVDALFKRYADSRANQCQIQIFIVGKLSPGKEGNNLIVPPALSLNGSQIQFAGSEEKIREFCQNVEELDLTSNHLTSFVEVFKIVRKMPSLKFLNLSENDFSSADIDNIGEPIESLETLVLNNTKVPWDAVNMLLKSMPNLQNLHLSLNDYTTEDMKPNGKQVQYVNVKRLYISKNPNLKCWSEIRNLLWAFPQLETLSMSHLSIANIIDDLNAFLPNLQSINITGWPIACWTNLEKFNNSPKLIDLRCQGIQLLEKVDSLETRRQHIIARLYHLRRLNGSDITPDERVFAEKAFVRYYLSNASSEKPPRFYSLHSIYGRVDPLAEINLAPPKYARVKLIYENNVTTESENEKLVNEKPYKLDLNKSVKDFKSQMSLIFGLPSNRMRVFYIDHVMIQIMGPEELRFPQKKLYTYNVQDGDQFLIDEKICRS